MGITQKKSTATAAFLLTLFVAGFGQRVQIGLHGGSGKSQLSNYKKNQEFWGAERLVSTFAGVDLHWNFSSRWAVDYEFNYAKKGSTRYYIEKKYLYVGEAINLRYNLRKGNPKRLKPYLRAGGYVSLLRAEHEKRLTKGPVAHIGLVEFSPARKFDFGLSGGAGVDFRLLPKVAISVEGRVEHGLNDVFGLNKEAIFQRKRIFNIAAWGVVGVKYGL